MFTDNVWATLKRNKDLPGYPWEIPFFGKIIGNKFHYFGGCTYSSFKEKDIIKYYEIKDEEEIINSEFAIFYKDYPPYKSTPEEFVKYLYDSAAWLSRKGDIYLCSITGHDNLARRLIRSLRITDNTKWVRMSPGDYLVEMGWIKTINTQSIFYTKDPSQKQLDTLFDVYLLLEKNERPSEIKEYLKKVFQRNSYKTTKQ